VHACDDIGQEKVAELDFANAQRRDKALLESLDQTDPLLVVEPLQGISEEQKEKQAHQESEVLSGAFFLWVVDQLRKLQGEAKNPNSQQNAPSRKVLDMSAGVVLVDFENHQVVY
jgi:hypothetical protein